MRTILPVDRRPAIWQYLGKMGGKRTYAIWSTTPGVAATPEYQAWMSMWARCLGYCQPDTARNYHGRGIVVCEEWRQFEKFLAHVGYRPSRRHTLDRINNEGDYEPGNVRWATRRQQARNRRPYSEWHQTRRTP